MKINDLISMAFKNLSSRKLRTFLTVLGVIIGCASIVVMVSLGNGITKSNEDFIKSLGNITDITVRGKTDSKTGKQSVLKDKNITELEKIPHVKKIIGLLNLNSGNISFSLKVNNRYEGWAEIIGIDSSSMEEYGLTLAEGAFPTAGDKLAGVFGPNVKQNLGYVSGNNWRPAENLDMKTARLELVSNSYDPTNQTSTPVKYKLKFTGELVESQNWQTSSAIFVPMQEVRKILVEQNDKLPQNERDKDVKTKYSTLVLQIDNMDNVKTVKEYLTGEGYQAEALTDFLESSKSQMATIQAIFGGIGAVSLLVAAIGISNTMVMSIHERTKEIGVMKVIGASIKDIQRLFLVEASFIGLFGGILGLILSYTISYFLNKILGPMASMGGMGPAKISIINIPLAAAALVFTSLIGLISGYFPARRAMSISALDAMRSE